MGVLERAGHRIMKQVTLAALFAVLSVLVACRGDQTVRGSMVDVEMTNWEVLEEFQVNIPGSGRRYRATFEIPIESDHEYSHFRVVAHGWTINIAELIVYLDGGEAWETGIGGLGVLGPDAATDILQIPGGPRSIERIEMKIQNATGGRGALVYFWGKL